MSGAHRLCLISICCLGAGLLAPFAGATGNRSISSLGDLNAGVIAQLNVIRAEYRLPPLTADQSLAAAARQHTTEMLLDGYFAHTSSGGGAFWKRLQLFYPPGQGSWSVGENLLWSSGALDSKRAVELWMASPEHRANILNPAWRVIGVSSEKAFGAPGTYGGRTVVVITTDFGARS